MKFEIYKKVTAFRRREHWGWRLVSANGKIVAVAGEKFATKDSAIAGAIAVQERSYTAPILMEVGGPVAPPRVAEVVGKAARGALDHARGGDDHGYVEDLNRVLAWCDAANVATGVAG